MRFIHLSIKDSNSIKDSKRRGSSKKLHQFGEELPDIRQIEGLPQALDAELGLRLQATKGLALQKQETGRNLHFWRHYRYSPNLQELVGKRGRIYLKDLESCCGHSANWTGHLIRDRAATSSTPLCQNPVLTQWNTKARSYKEFVAHSFPFLCVCVCVRFKTVKIIRVHRYRKEELIGPGTISQPL